MSHKNLNIAKELIPYVRFKYNLLVAGKKIKEINKLKRYVLVKKVLEHLKPKMVCEQN